ncbi:MAG: DUF859 family phage minor structural protein [Tenuifilaceae bacterium]|nr:DUF859 family phage minor structural protein [Tenuifilaceae bacterium]
MALSGTVYGTTNNTYIDVRITWSATQNIAANTSTISATAQVMKDSASTSGTFGTASMSLYIDGTVVKNNTSYLSIPADGVWRTVMTGSKTVTHASNGTKSFTLDFVGGIPGTSYTVTNFAYTGTLDTIPRNSLLTSFAAFTYGGGETVNLSVGTTSYSADFTANFQLKLGSTSIGTWTANLNGTTQTHSLSLTTAQQNTIMSLTPTTTSAILTMYLTTKYGTTTIGTTSLNTTGSLSTSVVPILSSVTVAEGNSAVSAITTKKLKNLSNLNVNFSAYSANGSASIVSFSSTFMGATYSGSNFNTGTLSSSGSYALVSTITDSRGRTATLSQDIIVSDYAVPSVTSFTVQRCNSAGVLDDMGTYVKVKRAGTVTSIYDTSEKNTITAKIYSKLKSSSTWTLKHTEVGTTLSAINDTLSPLSGYLTTSTYDFKFELIDKFFTTTSLTVVSTGGVVMSWGEKGIGIGKILDTSTDVNRVLDVGGNTNISGNTTISGDTTVGGDLNVSSFASNTKEALVDLIYPIGSIYITVSTTNPSILFPGTTWSAYAAGRVLVGQDTANSNFDTLEETGGSADAVVVSHSHRQKMNSNDNGLGNHSWHVGVPDDASSKWGAFPVDVTATTSTRSYVYTETVGASGTDKNLQPYIVVNMWKRIS